MFSSPTVRAAALSTLAAGAAVGLSACGVISSLLGGNVFQLEVGDCFNDSELEAVLSGGEEGGEVSDIPLVDCAEPHDAEFFYSHEMADGEFPGEADINTEAEEVCTGSAFTDFVGVAWEDSELFAWPITPTEQSWDALDDREILCYVQSEELVEGTLEGAGV